MRPASRSHVCSQRICDLQVALQLLHENFKPTPLQDTETMAFVPVVGAFRIKLTNTMLLDVAMDDSTSGQQLMKLQSGTCAGQVQACGLSRVAVWRVGSIVRVLCLLRSPCMESGPTWLLLGTG